MQLFDSHCHINDPAFDEDRAQVIARMRDAGIVKAVVVGSAENDGADVLSLLGTEAFLYGAYGLHPHNADLYSKHVEERIVSLMAKDKIQALGEIGLDYHYDFSPRETQKQVFARQLELASELDKPVVMHIREAHGDAYEILSAHLKKGLRLRGVMHCFGGSLESAQEYLRMGLFISFSGSLTFKNAPNLTRCAIGLPLDRILIETDSPYMSPVPLRGRRNEPANVLYVCQKLAELKEISPEEAAQQTYLNALSAFDIGG